MSEWLRAKEFFEAAEANFSRGDVNTAANREYFAAERAVVALLKIETGQEFKNHKNIWDASRILNLDVDIYGLLRSLYDLRLQADYGKEFSIVPLTMGSAKEYLAKVKALLEKIESTKKVL